ncbi:MAG: hypothetical protein LBI31_06845, partial [Zoogloeaceae bacterium]|nr:hypothetical protein [Zoogloeaceae bacterium]
MTSNTLEPPSPLSHAPESPQEPEAHDASDASDQLPLLHALTPPDLILHTPRHLLSTLWRPLQLFNGYRLALALTLALMPFYYTPQYPLSEGSRSLALYVGAIFTSLVCAGFLLSFIWKRHFLIQLSAQMLLDAICIGILVFLYEGVQSGLGLVLLLSIAGASLVTQGRFALFYAAIASLAILFAESLYLLRDDNEARLLYAGLLCTSFFTLAISVNRLGQRLMRNEALAHRRNVERNNQIQINMQVMEYMQDGVIVVDNAGYILSLNLKARDMLHVKDSRQLNRVFPALSEAYRQWKKTKSKASVILKQSSPSAIGDERAPNNAREISVRFVPTRASDETALIFIEDMEQLRNEALQLKLASLGRLTANIAHEIRNPLAAVSHATELLREEVKTSIQTRLIRIISDNTQRLNQIIQEILVLGRRNVSDPNQEKITLGSYLDWFVSDFSMQAGLEEGILCASAPEAATIRFNPAQLQQVLWNIV